jgi:hypothetical protein
MPQAEEMVKLELDTQRSVDMARDWVGGLRAEARGVEHLTNSLQELAEQLTVLYPAGEGASGVGHGRAVAAGRRASDMA